MAQEDEKKVSDQEEKEETAEEETEEYQQMELPPVTFENYVLGLHNTALIHLGFRDPETGEIIRNLPFARHTIDTLGMLQEKTKGNLTAPESNLLENILYDLRMNYLRADKQAAEEKTPKPQEEEQKSGEEAETQEGSKAQEVADEDRSRVAEDE